MTDINRTSKKYSFTLCILNINGLVTSESQKAIYSLHYRISDPSIQHNTIQRRTQDALNDIHEAITIQERYISSLGLEEILNNPRLFQLSKWQIRDRLKFLLILI